MADSARSKVKLWKKQEKQQKKPLFNKWKAGMSLNSKCKQILLNVYSSLQHENGELNTNQLAVKTSLLTGVGARSISAARREMMHMGKTTTPGRCRPNRVGKYTRVDRYEDLTLSLIRRKIHQFYSRREIPTVDKVLKVVNEDEDLPNFHIRTFTRLMNDIGFTCVKRKRNKILIERDDVMLCRHRYLRTIKQYRQENRKIFYLDETWINVGPSKQTVWRETLITSYNEPALTSVKPPPSEKDEKQLLLLHVGSQDGFIEKAFCLICPKKLGNSREEMTGGYFQTWFETKLIPNLPPNSVIVLDNSVCHSVRREEFPTKSWKKSDVKQWLTNKNIDWTNDMFKAELLNLAEPFRSSCNLFCIDDLARDAGHVVLRLPPYHCELNLMEEVWTSVKSYVAAANTTFKISDVEKLIKEAIGETTPDVWLTYVNRVKATEDEMWKTDCLVEKISEKIIVNFGDCDSMSESSTSEDDEATSRTQLDGMDAVFDLCFAELLSSDDD